MSLFDSLASPVLALSESEYRRAKLLAWILLFILLFSILTLLILLIFNPHHDPQYIKYSLLISGLIAFFAFIFYLNRNGYYNVSAILFIATASVVPWVSLLFDTSIIQGDFVPLTYLVFSVLLSSIFLSTRLTIALAATQFTGLALVLFISPATSNFNWFSFLAYVFLTSAVSILVNSIIQNNVRQIETQAHLLRLNEIRLEELSTRDHLTGLFNRRYLEETLEREIQRAARAQHPLGIIMLDVDHFKKINDTLGHPTGDAVLRELGKFLFDHVRQSDVACRYGGDEFVLILPDASRETTRERADCLQDGTKGINLPVSITISTGVAVFPEDGPTGEAILKSADIALYQAKYKDKSSSCSKVVTK